MIVQNNNHGKFTPPPPPSSPLMQNSSSKERIVTPRIPLTADGKADIDALVAAALVNVADDQSTLPVLPQRQYITTHTPHQWLDNYIEYSQQNSPRGFSALHEACGLWLLSATIAGRVTTNFGGRIRQTSLMIAVVARSSVWAKSHTIGIAEKVFFDAGLSWRELPTKASPQAIIEAMSNNKRVMEIYHLMDATDMSDEEIRKLKQELENLRMALGPLWAAEGQRAWHISEFGSKIVAGMMRHGSVLADFSDLLRDINEKVGKSYKYHTRGHGVETITNPYLAIIADTTPADLRKFAKPNAPLWSNGFFPRFAITAPLLTEIPSLARVAYERQFEKGAPIHLTRPLVDLNERLGRRNDYRVPLQKKEMAYSREIWEMLYKYEEFIQAHRLDTEDLDGSYTRLFSEQCVAISMMLAVVEGYDEILPQHVQRAIECCERIRQATEDFYTRMTEEFTNDKDAEQSLLEDRIVTIIQDLHQKKEKWPTLREIRLRTGNKKTQISNEKLLKILETLKESDLLEEFKDGRTYRYKLH